MKSNLHVTLRYYDDMIELRKGLDIPFVPQTGLKIAMEPISDGHPNAPEFSKALESSVLVTGIFPVDSVMYFVDRNEIKILSTIQCDESDHLDPMAQQLIYGYGFTETDRWPDND